MSKKIYSTTALYVENKFCRTCIGSVYESNQTAQYITCVTCNYLINTVYNLFPVMGVSSTIDNKLVIVCPKTARYFT